MKPLETAHLKAGAALLALIEDVVANGGLGCDLTKITDATLALAEHARLQTQAHLRQAAESVLIDRLAEPCSQKTRPPGTINGAP